MCSGLFELTFFKEGPPPSPGVQRPWGPVEKFLLAKPDVILEKIFESVFGTQTLAPPPLAAKRPWACARRCAAVRLCCQPSTALGGGECNIWVCGRSHSGEHRACLCTSEQHNRNTRKQPSTCNRQKTTTREGVPNKNKCSGCKTRLTVTKRARQKAAHRNAPFLGRTTHAYRHRKTPPPHPPPSRHCVAASFHQRRGAPRGIRSYYQTSSDACDCRHLVLSHLTLRAPTPSALPPRHHLPSLSSLVQRCTPPPVHH